MDMAGAFFLIDSILCYDIICCMKHHTKDKGDFGVLKAQLDLFQQGFVVAVPLTEHAPFDLIIYKDGICKTVQVKYRTLSKEGILSVQFKSHWSDKNGLHTKYVDTSCINVYCVYCPQTDECYYFDPCTFNKSVKLRVNPAKIKSANVHMVQDYRFVP